MISALFNDDIVQLAPDGTHTNLSKWKPSAAIKKLVNSAPSKLATAQAHVVNSLETYEYVDLDLAKISTCIKQIESLEDIAMGDLKAIVKERTAFFASAKKQFKAAKEILRTKMSAFTRRQEAVAKAAQAEADKEAERLRVEAMRNASKVVEGQSEEDRIAAMTAASETAIVAPTIVAAVPMGKTTYRDKWEMECDDFRALVEHIIKSGKYQPDIISLLMLDQKRANGIANDIRKDGHRFMPGLKVVNKRIAVT